MNSRFREPSNAPLAHPVAAAFFPHGLLISLFAAYCNAVAYGFVYGRNNHEYELAAVNWLRNPSLYPNDPITETFARYPTYFWHWVAYLSRWMTTEHVLWGFFWLTKALFFAALAWFLARKIKDKRLVGCVLLAVAFSPYLNSFTPFGTSDVLSSIQTNTTLAIALLLWSGILLVEGYWVWAAIVGGLAAYVNALFLVFTLFAFAVFAVVDWRRQKGKILAAAAVGAALPIFWLISWPSVAGQGFPKDYLPALRMLYPGHFSLGVQPASGLATGAVLLLAAFLMIVIAAKSGLFREPRLEILVGAYLTPVLLGALLGQLLLTPLVARLQLLRADSFLILYSILLIQTYGANLLLSPTENRAGTALLLGGLAVLLPLSDGLGLLLPFSIALALWASGKAHFESLARRIARLRRGLVAGLGLLLLAITVAGIVDAIWTSTVVILSALLGGCLLVHAGTQQRTAARVLNLALAAAVISYLTVAVGTLPRFSSFWHPAIPPTPEEEGWREVQRWAKARTPPDAQFLVPTYPGGFRVFSERSSWGEWKDGNGVYLDPAFAEIYLHRMQALGLRSGGAWNDLRKMEENYRRQSWDYLLALARQNHLSYVIQFRDEPYPLLPIFANKYYAVYKVGP